MPILSVIDGPNNYNFSRNKIYAEITTNNQTTVVNFGSKASARFVNLFLNAVNDTFKIGAYTYTFKTALNISLRQVRTLASSGLTYDAYLVQLANDLLTDPALSPYYNIAVYLNAITVTAKLGGTTFTLAGSTWNAYPASGTSVFITPPTDDIRSVMRPNYRLRLELFVKSGVSWVKVASVAKEPSNGSMRCDLAAYIDNVLKYDLPEFDAGWPTFKASRVVREFRIELAEMYGDAIAVQASTMDGTSFSTYFQQVLSNIFIGNSFFVLKAGVDTISERLMPTGQFNYYALHNSFLTRQPRVKKITRDQIEYLYFLLLTDPTTTVGMKFKFYNKYGVLLSEFVSLNTGSSTFYDVWAFPINRPGGQFSAHPEYTSVKVSLYDNSLAAVISEEFTYEIDDVAKPETTFVYFVNSDGGMDTMRLWGVNECKIEFEREIADRTITPDDELTDGDRKQLYAEKRNKFTLFSGWRTQAELNYVEDLFLSPVIYTYGNIYGQKVVIPLTVASKELLRNRTNMNLRGFVIEFDEGVKSAVSQAQYYPIP